MIGSQRYFRNRILLALLAVCVLVGAGTAVLDATRKEYRRNLGGHMASNVETIARVIGLLQHDSTARARKIADEPKHKELVARLIAEPDAQALHDDFEVWITPLYQSRGFDDYMLISVDGRRVMTSGTRPYIGQMTLPATQEALRRAELQGAAMAPPISAQHPVATLTIENPSAYAYQQSCARVDQDGRHLGFLCLLENPSLRLYRILRDGRPGMTGEVYVVNQEGQILSPIRFEKSLAAPQGAEPGWSLFRLSARVIPERGGDGRPDPAIVGSEPFTRVVERLLEYDSLDTGLLEDYADYRGRRVVGAGRWLPDSAMGLIVEEDMDEAYRSYRFARNALVVLIGVGTLLIVALTYVDWSSRRTLARSEQQLAAFRDHIPAGLNMKDSAGRYLMANPVFEAFFDFPPGHVLGRSDAELFPPDEARIAQADDAEVVRTGRPLSRSYTRHAADGREETYSIVRFPVRDRKDGPVAAVGMVALDVTDQIRTQRDLEELTQTLENKVAERTGQLAAARDIAEKAGRAKAEFLANMSHEIRTPLNAIIGMSHLAAHVNSEPRLAHYIGRIQSSSRHLLGVVNDILDLSKIEAGKLSIGAAEFSLEGLLDHVAGLVAEDADAKGLELIIAIAPGLPGRLIGDSMRIGQILINFANNAVKFTDRGEIVLRVLETGRGGAWTRLRFEVEDTGIGIAEDKLPLLFSPFQQLDGSMSRRFGGTGLGLAISRHLAELMDGSVGVKSHPGQGSVFWTELSLRIADAASAPVVPKTGLRDLYGLRALVVDDHAHARSLLAEQLRSLSFQVDEACGGQEAIALIGAADSQDRPYDVVFLDWKMPEMDGLQTAERLRRLSLRRQRPRLALIAAASQEPPTGPGRPHIDAVLAKPVTPSDLFDAVINLFDSEHVPAEQACTAPADRDCLAGREILLVEDNRINQEVVQNLLDMVGARVSVANDGRQGIERLGSRPFDLVLMDIHMPNMDGFEATAAIRKDPRLAALPIVALTANALEGDVERCLAAGMNDYVAKPIEPNRLFSVLARHLPKTAAPSSEAAVQSADAAGKRAPDGCSGGTEAIVARLAGIPGIDVARGISRMMGRHDLYVQLACRVAAERADTAEKLRGALREGDREAMRGLIHDAKSILGALGAESIQQRCIDLQKRLSEDAPAEDDVAGFAADLAALLLDLNEAVRPPAA